MDQASDPVFDVCGLVIVVTGACGLIGRAMAKAFHERGARLVLVDIAETEPEKAAAAIGGGALGISANVADAQSVAAMVENTLGRFDRVDVLVNNHQFKPLGFLEAKAETFPEELWDQIIDVNLKGTFLTCRDFGRVMLDQGKGSIINLASTYGLVSSNPALYSDNSLGNPVAYSASKGGVIMLSKYLAAYWAKRGVRVNCITPHGVWNNHEKTFEERYNNLSPMGRMMHPGEIVGPVVFLASDASSYTTGANLLVEGGWTAW
jgi:NAD(P)-dependent dehydrogenase (short-subunit alcohol dehydrogenase family)